MKMKIKKRFMHVKNRKKSGTSTDNEPCIYFPSVIVDIRKEKCQLLPS